MGLGEPAPCQARKLATMMTAKMTRLTMNASGGIALGTVPVRRHLPSTTKKMPQQITWPRHASARAFGLAAS